MLLRRRRPKGAIVAGSHDQATPREPRKKQLLRNEKLKMSPFPEEPPAPCDDDDELVLKDSSNNLRPPPSRPASGKSRRRSKRGSMLSESELPSSKRQATTSNPPPSSTMIKSMWEHAMTFMKGALDAMFDRTKATPASATPLSDDVGVSPGGGGGESPGEVSNQSPATDGEAPTVLGDDADTLSAIVCTPPTPGAEYSTRSPYGVPSLSSIKHPALHQYYRESPEALVQHTRSFSSLLQERAKMAATGLNLLTEFNDNTTELVVAMTPSANRSHPVTLEPSSLGQSNGIPVPPPLPPVPPPPPATPTLGCMQQEMVDGQAMQQQHKYSTALHSMQSRLQKRIQSRGGGPSKEGGVNAGSSKGNLNQSDVADVKQCQWAEIQAHCKKMAVTAFLQLAEEKRATFLEMVQELGRDKRRDKQLSRPQVVQITEAMHAAPEWYPGGTREIRDTVPGYKVVERKVETMMEFVQVSEAMAEAVSTSIPSIMTDKVVEYTKLKDDFTHKHKVWAPILANNARVWLRSGMPVDEQLLVSARGHMLQLLHRTLSLVHKESARIEGTLLALKCWRTTTAKQWLLECLDLLMKTLDVWEEKQRHAMDSALGEDIDALKESVLLTAHAFIHISLGQYEGYVAMQCKQDVMGHFEEVLKVVGLMKTFVLKCCGRKAQQTGYIVALPASEELATILHASCSKLIEHIITKSDIIMEAGNTKASSRNVVLWMMFGCKYVNKILDFLGSEQADEQGMGQLLASLERVESVLQ